MSLSPKDMDFMEAKHAAAREIALAFGVPPQLLGIPGDNTYSNYQEANRVFFRRDRAAVCQPLREARSAHWLAPAFGECGSWSMRDQIDGAGERSRRAVEHASAMRRS